MFSRREVLAGAMATLTYARAFATPVEQTLRKAAADKGLFYGAAVNQSAFLKDLQYRQTLAKAAGMLVGEGATKRNVIESQPGVYDYSSAEQILNFAHQNQMKMRGHTLVWHDANPKWLVESLNNTPSRDLLTNYVTEVAGHFRGKFHSWDVVNEAIFPDDGEKNGMRSSSPWYKAFGGERYIDEAFFAAKAADPGTLLFYNEANIESDFYRHLVRREATLSLLERLKSRNVPVDGLGIQGHLKAYGYHFDENKFSRFLDDVGAMGLKVIITELDVADIGGPRNTELRDADVAALTKRFLDVAFSKPFTLGCLTWGLSDRYSWLSKMWRYKWADGSLSRGLPFDENFKPKPMWQAMASAYEGAKVR